MIPAVLALIAAPAMAAGEPARAPTRDVQPTPQEVAKAQRQIADPAMGAALGRMMPAISRALMNMPVGEIEAAIEGRAPNAADRKRTVQDSIGGPAEAARVERELAVSGVQMQAMQQALAAALPGMIAAAGALEREMDRVGAAIPVMDTPSR